MALKASTGLRTAMLGTGSLVASIPNPVLIIYGGPEAATADAAATGTPLCTISANSTGAPLQFGAAAAGSLPKDPAQVWSGINSASGTATHFRIVSGTDDGSASTTQPRLQGKCGTAGADINMSSVNLTLNAPQSMDAASITLPTF